MKKFLAVFLTLALAVSFVFPSFYANALEVSADTELLAAFSEIVTPAVLARQTNIDISSLSLARGQLSGIFQAYRDLEPLSFPLGQTYRFSFNPTNEIVKVISVNYKEIFPDEASIAAGLEVYNAAINEIVGGIHGDWSEEAVLVYIVNYLCSHYVYDYDYSVSDVYSFVQQKKGVCQAFTLFTAGVLHRLGIVYDTVVSRNLNHIWNRVKIRGVWYHIDFTWANVNSGGIVRYENFLRGEEFFRSNHVDNAYDWTSQTVSEDAGEDFYYNSPYLWYGSSSSFVYNGGYWYYSVYNTSTKYMDIMRTADFITGSLVTSTNARWYSSPALSTFYTASYGSVAASGRCIIYNTAAKLYIYDPLTRESKELYDVSDEFTAPNFIYGFEMISEYDVRLNIRSSPSGGSNYAAGFVAYKDVTIPEELRLSPAEAAVRSGAVYRVADGLSYILGISAGTTAADIMNALLGTVVSAGEGGAALDPGEAVASGAKLTMDVAQYTLVVAGDVNADGAADESDSVYLLKALLSGDSEAYPVCYYQDLNGDSVVDTDDAVYLLKHSLNPELYLLHAA